MCPCPSPRLRALLTGALLLAATSPSLGGAQPVPSAPIAFADQPAGASGTVLAVVDPAAGTRTLLGAAEDEEAASAPSWSPDRTALAYSAKLPPDSVLGRRFQVLRVLDRASGERRPLTSGPYDDAPDWHPDGTSIALASAFGPDTAEQQSFISVVTTDEDAVPRPLVELADPDRRLDGPNWSPDGTQLALVVHDRTLGGELYVMRADGSAAAPLLDRPGWDDVDVAWSPDGGQLAFASGVYRGPDGATRHDIWLYDRARDVAGAIVTHPTWDLRHPAWSPDGRRLVIDAAVESPTGDRRALHVVPASGGTLREALTTGRQPAWAAAALPTTAPTDPPPTVTSGPSPTAEATTTPPVVPTDFPVLPTPRPFPTQPPTGPTLTPGAPPTFPPPPSATPTASRTASATPTATVTPGTTILLPYSARGHILLAVSPTPSGTPPVASPTPATTEADS